MTKNLNSRNTFHNHSSSKRKTYIFLKREQADVNMSKPTVTV
jgi:hypothetical protein